MRAPAPRHFRLLVSKLTETVSEILRAHRSGTARPTETVARTFERIRAHNDPALFISLRDENDALAEAKALEAGGALDRPLFGVPVAVKDNIDAEGFVTTAACPAFSYKPTRDSTAVAKLRQAGAIVIGKTNLDQFATGLVGVRSPYGVPRNAVNPELVPGGSSSGSAVAVAAGLVPLSLGTDTAGSGRVPAGLNNIVGLKPSLGLISTAGVVPACRSLDCVSVFALTTDDAWAALAVMAGPDAADPYSRARPLKPAGAFAKGMRLGVPIAGQRVFFGDRASAAAYEQAITRAAALGLEIVEVDIEPFYETARLLYEGPWVAERYIAIKSLLASSPESIHPVTREIIVQGARPSAVDAFAAFYKIEELRRVRDVTFRSVDALLLPTAPTAYTVKQVLADPIQLNSRLGTYTNFVNLLDLCGLAVPAAMRDDGIPFGVTLLAPGGHDGLLASIGRAFHADTGLPMGALGRPQPPLAVLSSMPAADEIAIAVVGAHLSGMPLNGELKTLGARLLEATATASDYRLYALAASNPPKPGLLRVGQGQGSAIALEIWALSAEGFGQFVAAIPPPMSIGTLRLADGRTVKGFLVEADAVSGAADISSFGGWRNYLAQAKAAAG
ncbi:MAG: allophanate hydrolase [Xanthobacteraceae bacterium]|nr:allophanate hydrolase [Xanthobacteraceae bacterium]